jgi:hypothetical protein
MLKKITAWAALVVGVSALCAGTFAGAAAASPCDDLDPSVCLLPFPNDYFTRPDSTTVTGKRVDFGIFQMPSNSLGLPIDPTDWNRADGFSPGSLITTHIPGLDNAQALAKTNPVPDTDIAQTFKRDAPVVVIDAATGKRQIIWVELDSQAKKDSDRGFMIRPAKNLLEGHRYIVALRFLKDRNGNTLQPQAAFKALRDGHATGEDASRQQHFNDLFKTLEAAGIKRQDLYLAWDFTIASARSTTGRMLQIRNDAFHQLGDDNLADLKVAGHPPAWHLTTLADQICGAGIPLNEIPPGVIQCGTSTNEKIVRDIKGTMTVPCYLSTPGCLPVHSQFVLSAKDGMPIQTAGNMMQVEFECRIPASAVKGGVAHPTRISLYGHGLFGSYGEVRQGQLQNFGVEHNITFCATDWAGMATIDVPNAVTALTDLSNFPTLVDRTEQGFVNFLMLGRLMLHPQGLAASPAFQLNGKSLLNTRELYYDGNSQGGIFGGALTAVAPDFTKATLGVPGMNYSTLLQRSSDFGTGEKVDLEKLANGDLPIEYAYLLYKAYPNELQRPLLFGLIQMLWDRSDPDGYAQHMTTDPLPDTPQHRVELHVAVGDHQVANISALVEARTIGAHYLYRGELAPGRYAEKDPFYGLTPFKRLPGHGSAIVFWDSGSPVAPVTNTPPKAGQDPHEHPRNTPANRLMKSAFLHPHSKVIDACNHGPCYANGYKPKRKR